VSSVNPIDMSSSEGGNRYCSQHNYSILSCHIPRTSKGGYTLVTLPRIVTPYREHVDETRGRVTYQNLVTR
jgi:hypothetical protein